MRPERGLCFISSSFNKRVELILDLKSEPQPYNPDHLGKFLTIPATACKIYNPNPDRLRNF